MKFIMFLCFIISSSSCLVFIRHIVLRYVMRKNAVTVALCTVRCYYISCVLSLWTVERFSLQHFTYIISCCVPN
jgi:hypothetical protein